MTKRVWELGSKCRVSPDSRRPTLFMGRIGEAISLDFFGEIWRNQSLGGPPPNWPGFWAQECMFTAYKCFGF